MKISVLATALIASLVAIAPARAQQGDWRDDVWGVRYAVGSLGWELRTTPPTNQPTPETFVFSATREGVSLGPRCALKYVAQPDAPRLTRADLNARTLPTVEASLDARREHMTIGRVRARTVDGVEVVQFEVRHPSIRGLEQQFFLLRDGEVRAYWLSCSAAENDHASFAAMSALAASLRFAQ